MEQLLDQIRTWRRHLHAIPEIGFQEYKTSKYLYEELKKMGYQPLKITETGIAIVSLAWFKYSLNDASVLSKQFQDIIKNGII